VPEFLGSILGIAVLAAAVRWFVPLFLATLGGLFNERSGVVNIGIDGIMVFGTWFGAWGALEFGPVAGLLVAVVAGVAFGALHALATVTFRVDQIVSGVAINILAIGLPRFLSILAYEQPTQSPQVPTLPRLDVPVLGQMSPVVPLALLLGVGAWYVFRHTVLGLRLRSSGENPHAAETLGVRVVAVRYAGVMISGGLAGLAGAYISVELVGQYTEGMNQGRGFIALAALILGNWSAVGVAWSCLLFGWTQAIAIHMRADIVFVPIEFVRALPYIVTLVVLAMFYRRVRPPRAVGRAYESGAPV
jgi:ABC-type uncharacterized transport system permease subunit